MQADAIFEEVLAEARQTPGPAARKLAALLVRRRPAILALITKLLAAQYALDPAEVPSAPPLEAYSAPAPALRWPALSTSPPLSESDYVPAKTTEPPLDPPLLQRYDQPWPISQDGGRFSTTGRPAPSDGHQDAGPFDMSSYPFVVGAWRIEPREESGRRIHGGPIERIDSGRIEQLRVLTTQVLEQVRVPNDYVVREGKVARYADWLREGHAPPPVVVKTLHDGTLEIIDGGSRWRAAIAAEKPLLAWVSDAVRTGVKPWGEVQFTALTFDLVNPTAVLSAVRGRDRGDPSQGHAFERAAEVLRIRRGWLAAVPSPAIPPATPPPARPSTQRGGAAGESHIPRRAHTHHLILGDIEEDPPLGEPDNPHAYRSSQPTQDAVLPHGPRSPCTCGLPAEHPLHTAPPTIPPPQTPLPLPGDHFRGLLPQVHQELVAAEQDLDQADREYRHDDQHPDTRPVYATLHVSYLKKLRAGLEALARRADRDDIPAALRTTRTRSQLQVLLQTGSYNLSDEGRIAQGALMDLVNEQWNKEIEEAYWKTH